ILCEKPLALDEAECREMAAAADEAGVLLMEAFMYRFHPQWRRVVDLIRSNEIGEVHSVQGFFSYDNHNPADIRNQVKTGGGALYDIGCYAISSARLAMGGEPVRVVSLLRRDPSFGTDSLSSAVMDFGAGENAAARQAIFTAGTQLFGDQRVDIHGTGGKITVHLPFNVYPDTAVTVTVTNGVGARDIKTGPVDMYGLQFDAFSRAVRNGGPAPTPPSDALANMKVIDALFRSEKSGSWETVR
ncbi:Gfo/Idh/MocA family protein, partial [Salinispira pacifica]